MTEQFRFDEIARDCRHVDGDKRAGAALAVVVQRARDQLFTCARFTRDHHGEVGLHQPRENTIDLLHRRRAADERNSLEVFVLRRRRARFLRLGQGAPDDRDQFLEIERFRQIFIGAALRRADRCHECVLGAHHHDRKIGTSLSDPGNEVECIFIRHDDVGNHQIAVALRDPAPQRGGIPGRANLITGP